MSGASTGFMPPSFCPPGIRPCVGFNNFLERICKTANNPWTWLLLVLALPFLAVACLVAGALFLPCFIITAPFVLVQKACEKSRLSKPAEETSKKDTSKIGEETSVAVTVDSVSPVL